MSSARIANIMKPYFDLLTSHYSNLAEQVKKNNISPDAMAHDYLSDPGRRENFGRTHLADSCAFVVNFWKKHGESIYKELNATPGLKARFGGDLGPQYIDNIFERTGLYFDTIIVPDPLLRIAVLPDVTKTKDFYFLKYAIMQVLFKDIYLADTTPPIAVLVPETELVGGPAEAEPLFEIARVDTIAITNLLYGQKFETFNQLQPFYSKFKDLNEAVTEVQRPDLILFDEHAERSPLAQAEAELKMTQKDFDFSTLPGEWQSGNRMLFSLIGRMGQTNDILRRCLEQGTHPIISAPVSFHWAKLKIETNQELIAKELGMSTNINLGRTNALLAHELDWLGNVPLAALVDLRKKGKLGELRGIIDKDLGKLSDVPLGDLEIIASQIDYNLSSALEQHQEKVKDLNSTLRRDLTVSTSTLATTVMAALQPAHGTFLPAWIKSAAPLVGSASLKEIVTNSAKYFKEKKTLGKSPVGILWQAKSKETKK